MKANTFIMEVRSIGFVKEYCTCRYIAKEFFDTLVLIAAELNRKFPDRKAQNLEIVTACPPVGEICVGSPAHLPSGDMVDINYFTLGDTNHSQWPAPIVDIWEDRTNPESKLSGLFDTERNISFITMVYGAFPNAQVIVDTRIKDAMLFNIHNYGAEEMAAVKALDAHLPMHMYHHTHVHIDTKGYINWDYVNTKLTKEEIDMNTNLYFPHTTCDLNPVYGKNWETEIAIINSSGQVITGALNACSMEGKIGETKNITIPAFGRKEFLLSKEFINPSEVKYLIFNTASPLVQGYTRFFVEGAYSSALAALKGGSKQGIFAKIEKNGWTGIAFINTENTVASITLSAYNDNGSIIATKVLSVNGNSKVVNMIEGLFTVDISKASYVTYLSDKNIAGFQLIGSSDGKMLDGFNALCDSLDLASDQLTSANILIQILRAQEVSLNQKISEQERTLSSYSYQIQDLNTRVITPDPMETFWNSKYPKTSISWLRYETDGAYAMDIRNYFQEHDDNIPIVSGSTFDGRAFNALDYVIKNVAYTVDTELYKANDYWAYSYQTLIRKKGDCEDGAILMANIMLRSGIPYWRIRLNAGNVLGGGHAYVTYCRETDNQFVILDWCYSPSDTPISNRALHRDEQNYNDVSKNFSIWFSWNSKYIFGQMQTMAAMPKDIFKEIKNLR